MTRRVFCKIDFSGGVMKSQHGKTERPPTEHELATQRLEHAERYDLDICEQCGCPHDPDAVQCPGCGVDLEDRC